MYRFKLATAILAALFFASLPGHAQDKDVATIADEDGCKVYNPMPQPEESIRWNGECRDGFAHGTGILDWYLGDELQERYEGELNMGWAEGEGTYVSRQGSRYRGEWKHSMQHGKGTIQNADGSMYQGEWKEGKPNGYGVYRTPSGETIEGEWVDGELKAESGSRRI